MMAQRSPPHRGRALIVDDETLFALSLEADMRALGFNNCDLATKWTTSLFARDGALERGELLNVIRGDAVAGTSIIGARILVTRI